ncbi:AraC family transcriptional regulator [Pseudoduganella plicata]|uniref:AraC family transcriptional regulator n=1 Tax=Pseudoduganella plicata TaxID=321984 RepID=A0A4P7BBY4_9BURK|nr:AraC family transcriptional regulator [Pseudoduganella plicata]QBQ35472.1 AraC family transcriptional regulator [Pseudoduganella plicata]GGZ02046.1 AraC family transcriptional regulator [Pseudoduganella plicata]
MTSPATPTFWRDAAVPFLEARAIDDGRHVCYARHAHETFSIGLITGGASEYVNGTTRRQVRAGSVVLMNPGDVHACNPLGDEPWAYRMFYVDCEWLGKLQQDLDGGASAAFRPYAAAASEDPALHAGLAAMYDTCVDRHADPLAKHGAAIAFFTSLHETLRPVAARAPAPADDQLRRAADYIGAHCMRALKLDEICAAAGLSPSHLIRSFKARYGMTPHAWLVNCRIQLCRRRLKAGEPIADVALAAGFADQAHLQRAFKLHVAATPGQYRASAPAATVRSRPAAAPSRG